MRSEWERKREGEREREREEGGRGGLGPANPPATALSNSQCGCYTLAPFWHAGHQNRSQPARERWRERERKRNTVGRDGENQGRKEGPVCEKLTQCHSCWIKEVEETERRTQCSAEEVQSRLIPMQRAHHGEMCESEKRRLNDKRFQKSERKFFSWRWIDESK